MYEFRLFLRKINGLKTFIGFSLSLFVAGFYSCTTYSPQYGKGIQNPKSAIQEDIDSELSHRIYLIGDAGNAEEPQAQETLKLFEKRILNSPQNSTLLFLGDNVYPKGIPDSSHVEKRKLAEEKLNFQLEIAKKFEGKTIFISGNHDWYSGLKGLEEQAKLVRSFLGDEKAFLPRKSCGLERLKLNSHVSLLVVDSQWYLENWDDYPTINADCSIKTRDQFFDEFKSELDKNQNETVIVAIHHPVISNSSHGGQLWSWKQQVYPIDNLPLPFLGSVFNFIRKTVGIPQDIHSKTYRELANRIKTEITDRENVVLVSGHEHNLQYLEEGNIKQIISGAASKSDPARAKNPHDFSYGKNGYAVLDVYEDKSMKVFFYGNLEGKEELILAKTIQTKEEKYKTEALETDFSQTFKGSIYPKEYSRKSRFYDFLWGKKYRDFYQMEIETPVLKLDTLYGGLRPVRAGGGMQSNSLRLKDSEGKEYVLRSLKKNTTRFLQSLYPEQYMEDQFEGTVASHFLYDFYTSSNPFYPFIVADLSETLGIPHSDPQLFYVPKQESLGKYNQEYGDEFYMLEERPMKEQASQANFGNAEDIISSLDLIEKIQKDEENIVDEKAFVMARIFDMLLGDWDRHQDQWRWAEHPENGRNIYRPIPRDRDQVFARYDGVLVKLLLNIPAIRHFQHFDEEPRSLKWLNKSGYPLDVAFLRNMTEKDWLEEAKYIQENLTDEAIEKAFSELPSNAQNEITQEIMDDLKIRRGKLQDWAKERYAFLQKRIVLTGTNKKEKFLITRMPNGKTEVKIIRNKKAGEELVFERIYSSAETKEIWIYGLDDDDQFEVSGEGDDLIKIRLIGGQNHDVYKIENGRKIIVYDYKTKKNTIENKGNARVKLSDAYHLNTYDFYKPKYNAFFAYPAIGYNPDDGVKMGANLNYEINGFNRDPFSQKHQLKGMYYFATSGFEFEYEGEFVNLMNNWNLLLNARWTSPNFSLNYFGYGNNTKSLEDEFEMDYNRVKLETLSFSPSIVRKGVYGTEIRLGLEVESNQVENTPHRFIGTSEDLKKEVFERKNFGSVQAGFAYANYDNKAFPTLRFQFHAKADWKFNLEDTNRNFVDLESEMGFTHKLLPSGKLVLSTLFHAQFILGDDFEFYQGAVIGGNKGLRGFRNERFLGNTAYYQSTDLRWQIGKGKGLIPMRYGILGGFDYGRVWWKGEDSQKWHQSFGGGIWLNAAEMTSLYLNLFHSEDGNRVSFGVGFNF